MDLSYIFSATSDNNEEAIICIWRRHHVPQTASPTSTVDTMARKVGAGLLHITKAILMVAFVVILHGQLVSLMYVHISGCMYLHSLPCSIEWDG